MQRIAITGSNGYLGQKLVAAFQSAGHSVLGIDISPVNEEGLHPDEFVQADIRDAGLLDAIRDFQADTIVHSAFVIRPLRDDGVMTDINIGGTKNILRIVETMRPARFLFLSSATAHGAWSDNPIPIPDGAIPRPPADYQYAKEKAALEILVAELAQNLPGTAVSWVRPALVGGPRMDNFLSRFIFGTPIFWKLGGVDHTLQFVHEDDVVGAIQAILFANGRGAFNLGPPNWTPVSEIAKEMNRLSIPVPYWLGYSAAWLCWKTKFWLVETPPSMLPFARYPWVVSPDRLLNEIGYEFKHSSSETMKLCVEHQSSLKIAEGRRRDRRRTIR